MSLLGCFAVAPSGAYYAATVASGPLLWSLDLSAVAAGALSASDLAALDGNLSFSRSSGSASFQTSAAAVSATLAAVDQARVQVYSGSARGLLLEHAATQTARDTRFTTSVGWSSGISAQNALAGPDGQMLADRVTITNAARLTQTGITAFAAVGEVITLSYWIVTATGATQPHQSLLYDTSPLGTKTWTLAASGWARLDMQRTVVATTSGHSFGVVEARDRTSVGGLAAHTEDVYADMTQLELGKFPTSYVDNVGTGTVTRAADRLRHLSPGAIVDGGRLGLHLTVHPLGASTEYPGTPYLWYLDANNHARWSASTRVVTVTIGGTTRTLGALPTWARGDKLEVWLAAGGGAALTVGSARVNAGAVTNLGSAAAQAALSGPSLDLLSAAGASHTTGMLRAMAAYRAGFSPDWAVAA